MCAQEGVRSVLIRSASSAVSEEVHSLPLVDYFSHSVFIHGVGDRVLEIRFLGGLRKLR